MPPRLALTRRCVPPLGLVFAAFAWPFVPLAGQELPLLRDYPGSGRYQCPAPETHVPPDLDVVQRASLLADDATQALLLGDFERSQRLLAQATSLDPTSADYRYRHAVVLENIGDADNALVEFCRAMELDTDDALGAFDIRQRIDDLYEQVRERIPEEAREAFVRGLAEAAAASNEDAPTSKRHRSGERPYTTGASSTSSSEGSGRASPTTAGTSHWRPPTSTPSSSWCLSASANSKGPHRW